MHGENKKRQPWSTHRAGQQDVALLQSVRRMPCRSRAARVWSGFISAWPGWSIKRFGVLAIEAQTFRFHLAFRSILPALFPRW